MAKPDISTKRLAITKANAQIVAVVGIAAFITVFCLVASKAVLAQNQYQGKVTKAKEKAHQQLIDNLSNYSDLSSAYNAFDKKDKNIIGGSKDGSGDNDGSNSKIVLDALPSYYDFPALTSSIEKILNDQSLTVSQITGTDDQVNQQQNLTSPTPSPVEIPFSFTVKNATYDATQKLIDSLQRSIRPIAIDTLEVGGGVNDMTITVNAHTYYQAGKSVNITKKVVK